MSVVRLAARTFGKVEHLGMPEQFNDNKRKWDLEIPVLFHLSSLANELE